MKGKKMKKLLICIISITVILALSGCTLLAPPDDDTTISVDTVYNMAKEAGYSGTLEEFINEFKGEAGIDGKDGVGIKSAEIISGYLVITYTDNTQTNLGLITSPDYEKITPVIGENGNWFVGGKDTGVSASGNSGGSSGALWHTGAGTPANTLGSDGDFYISTSDSSVYTKKNGAWVYVGTLEDKTPSESSGMSVAAINRILLSSVHIRCGTSSAGSGVIYKLDKAKGDAYIITNYHVVYDSLYREIFDDSVIKLYLYGMEYSQYAIDTEYVGGSAKYDIAVLKVSGSRVLKNSDAVAAAFADSEAVRPLDTVVVAGNSQGEGIATTAGHVNKESEEIKTTVGNKNYDVRVMRIDAAVNEGNSGGGAYNTNGDVIGIVNAKQMSEKVDNVGYAIPSNLAKSVAENIIYFCDGTNLASPQIVTVGINCYVSASGTAFDEDTGMVTVKEELAVDSVSINSIAYSAGVYIDDVIKSITVGGVEYEITRIHQVAEALLNARPGETVKLKVVRSGSETTLALTMSASEFSSID